MDHLSGKIKELREEKGIKRQELADALNISYWTLSKYENGERTPDVPMLVSMADIFGVTADELLCRNINNGHVVINDSGNAGYSSNMQIQSPDDAAEYISRLDPESQKLVYDLISHLLHHE